MWPETPASTTAQLPCSELGPSFNSLSYVKRFCSALTGQWESVDNSGCTFKPDTEDAVVIFQGLLDEEVLGSLPTEPPLKEVILTEVCGAHSARPACVHIHMLTSTQAHAHMYVCTACARTHTHTHTHHTHHTHTHTTHTHHTHKTHITLTLQRWGGGSLTSLQCSALENTLNTVQYIQRVSYVVLPPPFCVPLFIQLQAEFLPYMPKNITVKVYTQSRTPTSESPSSPPPSRKRAALSSTPVSAIVAAFMLFPSNVSSGVLDVYGDRSRRSTSLLRRQQRNVFGVYFAQTMLYGHRPVCEWCNLSTHEGSVGLMLALRWTAFTIVKNN